MPPTPCCQTCCHWAPNLEGQEAQEGVCQRLAQDPTYYGPLVTDAKDCCEKWVGMGFYRAEDGEIRAERRAGLRTRIDIPARLHTTSGDQSGRLADISEYGAGLQMYYPPPAGTPGVLKWCSNEVFCSVAWANDGSCGVTFEKPISRELVLEMTGQRDEATARAANPAKIPLGQKRPRRRFAT